MTIKNDGYRNNGHCYNGWGDDVILYNGWYPSYNAKNRTARAQHDPSPYCWALMLLVDG